MPWRYQLSGGSYLVDEGAMTESEAYEFVAKWHDKLARGCKEISEDEPRIGKEIRDKAAAAGAHHAASAASLRNLAWQTRRKELGIAA